MLAYNAKDLIALEPASVTVTWDGEKTAIPPKLFVVAVGLNDCYDSRLRLSYAVPDATAIAEGFRKAGTGLYAAVDVTTVLDKDVTIANLDKVFTELGKKAQPRDVFVFFLAGHGKTKNGRYYILPPEDEDSIEKAGMDQDSRPVRQNPGPQEHPPYDAAIPTKPTHVIITTSPTDVFESIIADRTKGIAVQCLSFGTPVVVVQWP